MPVIVVLEVIWNFSTAKTESISENFSESYDKKENNPDQCLVIVWGKVNY